MKLRIGDKVKVTAGKDKGKTGKIKKTYPLLNKVHVDGVNKYKKHLKAQGERKPGGIIDIERPLPTASVAILCPNCKQQTRVGFSLGKGGKKTRICRKCKSNL